MSLRRACLIIVTLMFLINSNSNCLYCSGEYIEGETIKDNATKYWQIFNWWELIKINDNNDFTDIWIKIVFKFTRPVLNSSYFELELNLSHKIYNLEVYPKNDTNAGRYLNYINIGKVLVLRINKSVVKHYKYYEVAIHYKIKRKDIVTEKFTKIPIINSLETTLRYAIYTTINIDDLIPKNIRNTSQSRIVNIFVALPSNTIEYHVNNIPKMLIISPNRFKNSYKKYFTEWIFVNYKNKNIPFRLNIHNNQPILYYVSGRSPTLKLLNYPYHEIYVEYSTTNYSVVELSFLATFLGLISSTYVVYKIIKIIYAKIIKNINKKIINNINIIKWKIKYKFNKLYINYFFLSSYLSSILSKNLLQ